MMTKRKNRSLIESLESRCLLSSTLPAAGTLQAFASGQTVVTQTGSISTPPTFSAVAEGPDGRLVTADDYGTATPTVSISRYLSTGAIDTTFGSNGTITLTTLYVSRVIINPDATILLIGSKLERLTSVGAADGTFDGGGAIALPFTAAGAAVETNGDILVSGGSGTSAAVYRYTTTGALDNTFGSSGKVTIPDPAGVVVVGGVAVDPEGGSVVSVGFDGGPDVLGVYRLAENGVIATSFGYGGLATSSGLDAVPTPGQIAVTADDAYIYQVGTYSAQTVYAAAYVVAYSSDGADSSEVPIPLNIGTASDLVALNNDEFVVAGSTSVSSTPATKQIIVARYLPLSPDDLDVEADTSFGTNGGTLISYNSPATSTSDQSYLQGNNGWSVSLGTNGTIAVGSTTVEPAHGSTAAIAKFDLAVLAADPGTVEAEGTLSGTVFADTNGDGVQDSGETGLADYGVFLDDNGDGTFDTGDVRVLTDATGHYQILGLTPGTYTVTENLGAGQGHSQPADTNSYSVTVTADATVTGGGFGVITSAGTITGTLFDDVNGDGIFESTEPVLAGWGCYLDLNDDGTFDGSDVREYANASGIVAFSGLSAGTYYIEQNTPTGYQRTTPKSLPIVIKLAQGGTATFSIGDQVIATTSKGPGVVKGIVFNDQNANGTQGSTETGLASRTVYADIANTGIQNSGDPATVTAANGTFTLTGVPVGSVTIRLAVPAGTRQTTPAPGSGIRVTITGSTPVTGLVFGSTTTAEITGTVFTDTNGNGVQNSGEVGTNNVKVFVDMAGTGKYVSTDPSAITNTSGVFVLNALVAGTYKIGVVVPTGTHQTTPAGSAELSVKVAAGQISNGSLFGVS